jgi:hypothetical protein
VYDRQGQGRKVEFLLDNFLLKKLHGEIRQGNGEVKFEGLKYVVGDKTGRVYEARDTGDIFAGFIGVGKFKKMTK